MYTYIIRIDKFRSKWWSKKKKKNPTYIHTTPQFTPLNNHAHAELWYLLWKDSVSIQLATKQNQHKLSQWIIPTPSAPPPPTNLPTLHITCWFAPTPYLHFYWPIISLSLRSLSGSAALSNRGNLSHSLIERLSGDYGEVRNKVVLRNHKHKPFHSLC